MSVKEVMSAAMQLPRRSRAKVAAQLLDSLSSPFRQRIDAAWDAEIRARIGVYDQGLIKAIPGEQVFAELDRRLSKGR